MEFFDKFAVILNGDLPFHIFLGKFSDPSVLSSFPTMDEVDPHPPFLVLLGREGSSVRLVAGVAEEGVDNFLRFFGVVVEAVSGDTVDPDILLVEG